VSPAYVRRQLGHAFIQLAVDTYAKWRPMGNMVVVDRPDDVRMGADGSRHVRARRKSRSCDRI